MKRKLVLYLWMTFCMFLDNNICAADKESSEQKSHIVVRVLKPAVCLLPLVNQIYSHGYYAYKPCGTEQYPHAQMWFDNMSKKYPVADLNRTEFCADATWSTIDRRIFFPTQGVEEIETIYRKKMGNQTLSPVEHSALKVHEFLLLHEAGHRKNADSSIVTACAEFTKQQIMRTAMFFSASNSPIAGYGLSVLANGVDFSDSILEKEKRADNFACKHAASTDVLQGGLNFFNYITMSGSGQFDFLHPNSQQRAQKVVDEIQRRWIDENTCPADK